MADSCITPLSAMLRTEDMCVGIVVCNVIFVAATRNVK